MSKIVEFSVVMRHTQALTKMLMLVGRLGGKLTYLSAVGKRATLVFEAAPDAAHRFGPQIRRIIDVIELKELRRSDKAGGTTEDNPAVEEPVLDVA